jgi:hypothetical protein
MDRLIHYDTQTIANAIESLTQRTRQSVLFTFAPHSPSLAVAHAMGRLFPRTDRSPQLSPTRKSTLHVYIERAVRAPLAPGPHAACFQWFLHLASLGVEAHMKLAFRPPAWMQSIMVQYVPFADAASAEPAFGTHVSLGHVPTLHRLDHGLVGGHFEPRDDCGVASTRSWWVAISVALPLVFAPLRALIGYRR